MGINKEGKLFAIEREITYRDYTLKESFRSGCPSFRPASCLIWFASVVCLSYHPRFTPPYSPLQSPHTTSTSEVEKIRKPRRPPTPIDINGRKRRRKKKAHKKSWTGLLPSLMQITLEVSCFVSRDVCRWCDVSYSYFLGRKIAPRKLWAY